MKKKTIIIGLMGFLLLLNSVNITIGNKILRNNTKTLKIINYNIEFESKIELGDLSNHNIIRNIRIENFTRLTDIDNTISYERSNYMQNLEKKMNSDHNHSNDDSFKKKLEQVDKKPDNYLLLGSTHYVGGIGPNNFTSIQKAIDHAEPGDSILIYDDSSPYFEHLNITKQLYLKGEKKETTTISGQFLESKYDNIIIHSENVIIENLSITQNNGEYYQAAIKVISENVKIKNCIIKNNNWIGIYLLECQNCIISDCEFKANLEAILLEYSDNNEINNCSFEDNADDIMLYVSNNFNEIRNCTSTGNRFSGIHIQRSSKGNLIENCQISNGYEGIGLAFAPETILRNNTIDYCIECFGIGSNVLKDFNCDIDTSNTINGKPIYYLKNRKDLLFDNSKEIGFLGLINCSEITIDQVQIENNFQGLLLANVSNSTIKNNSFNNNGGHGIYLISSKYNEISNCNFKNCRSFISLLEKSNYNKINNNEIIENSRAMILNSNNNYVIKHKINGAIILDNSAQNLLRENELTNGGITLDGNNFEDYLNDVDTSNTINGKEIYYLLNRTDVNIPNNAGQVFLINCSHCEISNQNLENVIIGTLLTYSTDNIISNNEFRNVGIAIDLDHKNNHNNKITMNTFSDNTYAIDVDNSDNNLIEKNNFSNNYLSIGLSESNNNHILNNQIINDYYGIYLDSSDENQIENNIILENDFSGIYIIYSRNNILKNNEMKKCGLILFGNDFYEYYHNIDTSNKVNEKPIHYLIDRNDFTINEDVGQIILVNCHNCTIKDKEINYATTGISLAYSNDNIIKRNELNYNSFAGLHLDSQSNKNKIFLNKVNQNGYGIYLQNANGNLVKNTMANANYVGIYLRFSKENHILRNTFKYNNYHGAYLDNDCNQNQITYNNFLYSSKLAIDITGNTNFWDNGIKGNYWNDYREIYPEAKKIFGIWNIPYEIIDGESYDFNPSVYYILNLNFIRSIELKTFIQEIFIYIYECLRTDLESTFGISK